VLAATAVALSACDNQINPNAPSPRLRLQDVQTQADTSSSFYISEVSLSGKTVVIDGPPASYTATVVSLTQSFKGLTVRAYFIQQHTPHLVGDQGLPCASGSSTCTYTSSIQAPTGLLPGGAIFELQLVNASGLVLSTRDVGVSLAAGQTISALNLSSTSLVLGGPSTLFSTTLQNPDSSLSGAAIQGWLVQSGANNARRAAGGVVVQCGSGSGILPHGTCTLSSVIVASNSTAGTGTLIPGAATFELDLMVNGTVVAQKTAPVSIKSSATITGLSLGAATSDTVLLEGSSAPYTAALQNIGSSLSGISIQGFVTQGTTRRFAGGTLVSCGGSSGLLPNGSCTVAFQLVASNNTAGAGTLSTGAATFELQLVDGMGTMLSTATIPLYIVDGPLESPPVSPGAESVVGAKRPHMPTR
jgi:hypothetical protein